jgi:hypothetical protein
MAKNTVPKVPSAKVLARFSEYFGKVKESGKDPASSSQEECSPPSDLFIGLSPQSRADLESIIGKPKD